MGVQLSRIDLSEETSSYIGTSERFWQAYMSEKVSPASGARPGFAGLFRAAVLTYFCPQCQRR